MTRYIQAIPAICCPMHKMYIPPYDCASCSFYMGIAGSAVGCSYDEHEVKEK